MIIKFLNTQKLFKTIIRLRIKHRKFIKINNSFQVIKNIWLYQIKKTTLS